jgi:peroxiredoxin
MLWRLDELEKRLDELEFGEVVSNEDDRSARFRNRPLARSKIKRDGLKAGTLAPGFRLPRVDGRGEFSLEELRGRRVLLVFSDPHCGPCNYLAPRLEEFHRATLSQKPEVGRVTPCAKSDEGLEGGADRAARPASPRVVVVMISRGEQKENRAKVNEHGLTFTVLLQRQWEISRLYAMFATPMAYLIDKDGVITNHVAVGLEAILGLMAQAGMPAHHQTVGALA